MYLYYLDNFVENSKHVIIIMQIFEEYDIKNRHEISILLS